MPTHSSEVLPSSPKEIIITRTLDAPRELVWEAWTDPKQVAQWWGPVGFTATVHEMEVKPGGIWRLTMHGPDGANYPNESVFTEVVKPERIVFALQGGKEGAPESRKEMIWTFEDQGGMTRVTIRQIYPTAEERDYMAKTYGAIEGGKQTLGRLAEYLNQ
jgi:uncharacterized protein YndB with AHSA1/START domain